ncbi:hypothetical protein LCGC14_0362100 [marine sediment metagenome]|uniref:Uncharacterized protein n=1 Tax=marine sediment metagenome TaxID=412755 RepID=A0A0F9TQJ8_9ZZZZ
MAEYRRKPVVVDAVQYFGDVEIDGVTPPAKNLKGCAAQIVSASRPLSAYLETGRGKVAVHPGDWIITDGNAIKSVCHKDLFGELYEEVK